MAPLKQLIDILLTSQKALYQTTQRANASPATVQEAIHGYLAALFKFSGAVDEMEAWAEGNRSPEPDERERADQIQFGCSYLLRFAHNDEEPEDEFGSHTVENILANKHGEFDAINEAAITFVDWSVSFRHQYLPVISDEFDSLLNPAFNPEFAKWVIGCVEVWDALSHSGHRIHFPVYSHQPQTIAECVTLLAASHVIVLGNNIFVGDLWARQSVAQHFRLLYKTLEKELHNHTYHELDNRERDFELLQAILAQVKAAAPLGGATDSRLMQDPRDDIGRWALRNILTPIKEGFGSASQLAEQFNNNPKYARRHVAYLFNLKREELEELARTRDINPDDYSRKTDLAVAVADTSYDGTHFSGEVIFGDDTSNRKNPVELATQFWTQVCQDTATRLGRIGHPELSQQFNDLISEDNEQPELWRHVESLVTEMYERLQLAELDQPADEPPPNTGSNADDGPNKGDNGSHPPQPGHLELIVDHKQRTVRRVGHHATVDLSRLDALWTTFMVFFAAGNKDASDEAWMNALTGEWSAHREHKRRLKEELVPLAVTIPDRGRRLIDDGT